MSAVRWADYPLFEYEKVLARREVDSLVGAADVSLDRESARRLQDRATFLHTVVIDGIDALTGQAATESRHRTLRGRTGKRQSTRFLVHGLHEYKGKFNPQLARSLVNVIDPTCTSLIDPYCGSGTTLIEGLRLGLNVGGVDQNPLAAWMTTVKIDVLRASGERFLVQRHGVITARVADAMRAAQRRGRATAPANVSAEDETYLRHWFPEPVLAAMWTGLGEAHSTDDEVCARVTRLTISSLVRSVSWQLPEDLRIRRRPDGWTPPDVADLFVRAAARAALALREAEAAPPLAKAQQALVVRGSSQDTPTLGRAAPGGRRLVVTSPPYATALPYIDTDRLSLVLLGLSTARDIRTLEQALTGSREWTTNVAREWREVADINKNNLPSGVLDLLRNIEAINKVDGAGFRRAALPTLLYRYFSQVGDTLTSVREILRPGERAVFVVGTNRTGRGESTVIIETPELIGAVAQTRGYTVDEVIPLETWPRYGLHAGNAVNAERAVVLTRT